MRLKSVVTALVLLGGGGLLSGCYVAPAYDGYYGGGYPGYYAAPSVNLYYNGGYRNHRPYRRW